MKSVLYVEDDADVSHYMQVAAVEAGLDLFLAESADEARALINGACSFDLAVLDERMPGAPGHTLLEILDSRDIPAVFYTAFAVPSDCNGHVVYDKGEIDQMDLAGRIADGRIEDDARIAKLTIICDTVKQNTERIERAATYFEKRNYG